MLRDQFKSYDVSTSIGGTNITVHLLMRNVKAYARKLVSDVDLAGKFHFYAEKMFYHDGDERLRLYGEPYTGDDAWRMQVSSHPNHHPFLLLGNLP